MADVFVSGEEKRPETPVRPVKKTVRENRPKVSSHNPLSSFCYYPEKADFETREKDEKIILLLRQHPAVNIKWIIISVLLLLVPSVAKYFGIMDSLPSGFELIIGLSWYLFILAYILENFMSWYYNVYFVTDSRIIDVDFYSLINKKVSSADLDKIQDVSYTHFGVWRMLFNYGDVTVQTASEVPEFDFLAVPLPERVVKMINDIKEEAEER